MEEDGLRLRTAMQVAERAVVMGAVAFRASLEVTDHPRAAAIATRIPKWLAMLNLMDAVDPVERDLLSTPYGQLDESQKIDANWSGEGAALFCWALGIGEQPPMFRAADQSEAANALKIMRPEAHKLLSAPTLRSDGELREFCKTVRLVRTMLRETHVRALGMDDEARRKAVLVGRGLVRNELADVGIAIGDEDLARVGQLIAQENRDNLHLATGAYVARDVAVTWLLDGRSRYFDPG